MAGCSAHGPWLPPKQTGCPVFIIGPVVRFCQHARMAAEAWRPERGGNSGMAKARAPRRGAGGDAAPPQAPAATQPTPRTRTNDPAGMRTRVLDVAATLFQEHGYHATSMHDVMAAAGVTGGALHHHFPSKKALGLAVIRERVVPAVAETCMAP